MAYQSSRGEVLLNSKVVEDQEQYHYKQQVSLPVKFVTISEEVTSC